MTVKDNIIPHIRDCKTSKETLDVFKVLYETTNTNQIFFLKTKLLSIKMEANASISNFISCVKELRDKLGDIGGKVSNTNLVTITLNGLVQHYQNFVSSLSTIEKPHIFYELIGILVQEEERMKNFNLCSNDSDLALVAKGKQPYKGKPWDKSKGGKFQAKQKGMAQSKFPIRDKRNNDCYYCGKLGHHAKDCYKRKYNESKQINISHNGNFMDKDTSINDGFKNLKLFVFYAAFSVEIDDVNTWFIDSSASLHMSCNKDWFDEHHENIDGTCVYLGDNRSLQVQGYGVIGVMLPNGKKRQIHDVIYVPGLEIWRESRKTITTQCKYAKTVLERFHMLECKLAYTSLEHNAKLYNDDGSKEVNGTLYLQLVGCLNYLTTTKPNIVYFVSTLSQFMAKPYESHWKEAKKVLRYLKETLYFGILYTNELDVELALFSNSDWAGNTDDRRSTSGYAFNLGFGVLSWSNKKQPIVSLSSTEAEYKDLTNATCEAIWLRRILEDVGEKQRKPTSIKSDNQSSMNLANNPIYHARTKHIEVQHHFVREKIQSNEINLVYSNISENVVDIFTKPLGKMTFEICRQQLVIVENPFFY
eukprot:PITA_29672